MNKFLLAVLSSFFIIMGFTGCKKNYITEVTPPKYAKFLTSVKSASYIIIDDPASEYKIPIGIITISDVPRTIQITYTSETAEPGVQYTAPTSITIPAGASVDTLRIKGLFAGYDEPGRRDVLEIRISGGDVEPWEGEDVITLALQKACPVILEDIEGEYGNTFEPDIAYGPYTTELIDVVELTETSAEGYIVNIFNWDWDGIRIVLNWSDPANITVTIPKQPTGSTESGVFHVSSSTEGVFSSCDETFSILLDLWDGDDLLASGYLLEINR